MPKKLLDAKPQLTPFPVYLPTQSQRREKKEIDYWDTLHLRIIPGKKDSSDFLILKIIRRKFKFGMNNACSVRNIMGRKWMLCVVTQKAQHTI